MNEEQAKAQTQFKKQLTDLINDPNSFLEGTILPEIGATGVKDGFITYAQTGIIRVKVSVYPIKPATTDESKS